MKPTILIAGATGATGSVATKVLFEKGFPVRALVLKMSARKNSKRKGPRLHQATTRLSDPFNAVNLRRDLSEGRATLIQAICEKV